MRFRDQNQNNIADDPGGQCGGHHAQKKRRRTVSDYSSETSDECDENCKFLETTGPNGAKYLILRLVDKDS